MSKEDTVFITINYLVPYLTFIKEHKFIYKVYMENITTLKADESYEFLLNTIIVPVFKKHKINDKTVINYMAKYFLNGINAIVDEWLKIDCDDDILLICELITICVRPTF